MTEDFKSTVCVAEVECDRVVAETGTVRLVHGPHDLYVPCYDLTVDETRIAYSDILNVSDGVEPYLNGTRVAGDLTVLSGDCLTFVKSNGKKGARRGAASITLCSAFEKPIIELAEQLEENWCRFERRDSDVLIVPDVRGIMNARKGAGKLVRQLQGMTFANALECWMCGLMLKNGPKLMRPGAELCRIVSELPINVSCGEYRQPFPVFLIELPDEFRQECNDRFDFECPRVIKVLHDDALGHVFVVWNEQKQICMVPFDMFTPSVETIEERIHVIPCDHESHVAVLLRVALNLSLLLTQYGAAVEGPVAPNEFERQRRNAESRSPRRRTKAQRQLRRSLNLITFEQDVVFKNWDESERATSGGDGPPKTPHWRRGHFKRVRIGLGRRETKRIFIPSTFVNGGKFEGDLADTNYRIRIEDTVLDDLQC